MSFFHYISSIGGKYQVIWGSVLCLHNGGVTLGTLSCHFEQSQTHTYHYVSHYYALIIKWLCHLVLLGKFLQVPVQNGWLSTVAIPRQILVWLQWQERAAGTVVVAQVADQTMVSRHRLCSPHRYLISHDHHNPLNFPAFGLDWWTIWIEQTNVVQCCCSLLRDPDNIFVSTLKIVFPLGQFSSWKFLK